MRWREGDLLDFRKVVLDVPGEGELAKWSQWDLALWPDLGQVENVPAELLGLLRREDLNVDGPGWVVSPVDGVEEIFSVPVWVLRRHLASFGIVEGLVALISLQVYLDIVESSIRLSELVGVARVTVHVSVGVWGTTVTEEGHDLVNRLLVSGKIVPEHGGILQVGLWVALLCMDEDGELGGVTDEEDRGVVEDPVPVTLLGVELDRETSGVTSSVWGTLLTTDSREANDSGGPLADASEHVN